MAGKNVLDYIKNFLLSFRRNWGLKLVSLLFAVILWNYVITEVNPMRPASFNDIKIVFDASSITQLNNSGFTVKGALPERAVSVTVDIPRNQFKNLSRDSIQATASLAGITSEGKKELKVNVYSPYGTLKSQSVSTISIEIEQSDSKIVPVTFEPEGELPQGYWQGNYSVTPEVIKVSGAKSLVSKVKSVRVVVDLSTLTERLSASRDIELLDEDGNVIDPDKAGLTLDYRNCIVNLEILPTKKVKVDVSKSLNGSVAKGYSIKGTPEVSTPEIVIAGPRSVLDTIDSVAPEPIDVSGASGDISVSKPLIMPKGVKAVGENTVTVLIRVEENMTTVSLSDLPVHVVNLGSGLKVDSKQLSATVTVTCPELMASKIKESMIRLTVNASGLDARSYTLVIHAEYDAEETGITAVAINPESILVTITSTQ